MIHKLFQDELHFYLRSSESQDTGAKQLSLVNPSTKLFNKLP